jgi:predicted HD phosphohydrolase
MPEKLYGPGVAEPVRLHVAAKRDLCGANPAYYDKLSRIPANPWRCKVAP